MMPTDAQMHAMTWLAQASAMSFFAALIFGSITVFVMLTIRDYERDGALGFIAAFFCVGAFVICCVTFLLDHIVVGWR